MDYGFPRKHVVFPYFTVIDLNAVVFYFSDQTVAAEGVGVARDRVDIAIEGQGTS